MSRRRDSRPVAATTREVIRFQTQTGSVYEVARTTEGMHWQRISATLASGVLRSEGARLTAWPDVRVGQPCRLLSEPFVPSHPRLVQTTMVVSILERDSVTPAADTHRLAPRHRDLTVGATVTRMLGGSIPMKLVVTALDDRFIYCGGRSGGWKFDRYSGMEVDEELGWGPQFGLTGSFLVIDSETELGSNSEPEGHA